MEDKLTKQQKIQIAFIIAIFIAIFCLVFTTITIIKYAKMLQNPVGYNMEKFGLAYCTCYDTQKRIVPIQSGLFDSSFEDLIPKPQYANNSFNVNNLQFVNDTN